MEDVNELLEQYAGVGTEDLKGGGTPFIEIVNKSREGDETIGRMLGQFWHTGLQKGFGKAMSVIPLAWKNIWAEKDAGGFTVAYHLPDSIELDESGRGADYSCTSADSGNLVVKTFIIPVVIPGEANSLALFVPGRTSLKGACEWRKMLNFNRLPSGAKAPIFANEWTLCIGKGEKSLKTGGKSSFFKLDTVQRGPVVVKEFLLAEVLPTVNFFQGDAHTLLPQITNKAVDADDVDVEGVM